MFCCYVIVVVYFVVVVFVVVVVVVVVVVFVTDAGSKAQTMSLRITSHLEVMIVLMFVLLLLFL